MQTDGISESQNRQKYNKTVSIILEAISYGFFGTVFVIFCDFVNFALTQPNCPFGFSCDTYIKRGIPLGLVFFGNLLSVLFIKFLFDSVIKSGFVKWSWILVITSITTILMQTVFIISRSDFAFGEIMSMHSGIELMEEVFGLSLMLKLFLFLAPFTILFANRRTLSEKIKANNYYPK